MNNKSVSKKVLFFTPFAIWSPHFETDLEIISDLVEKGNEVTLLCCDGDLKTCEPNPIHSLKVCSRCRTRRKKGLDLLGLHEKVVVKNWELITPENKLFLQEKSFKVSSLEELEKFTIDDADIGMGVLSSLISEIREPYPNINLYRQRVEDNLISACRVYLSIQNHLQKADYDSFYVFNGRFAALRAAFRAAQKFDLDIFVHERAGANNRYSLTANNVPHDLGQRKQEIENFWSQSPLNFYEKSKIAEQWFMERVQGKNQAWFSFTKNQIEELPDDFDFEKLNIVIFNSSEDEFRTIPGWENPIYKNQDQGILKIAESFEGYEGIQLYLRVHPNLTDVKNSQTAFVEALKGRFKNLTVISPDSKIGSYPLLKACDAVITFGSTVGIEASFWGKTSFLAGRALYEDLGVVELIESHNKLVDSIHQLKKDVSLSNNKGKEGYLKFGYYMSCYGKEYLRFRQEDVFNISFNGQEIPTKTNALDYLILGIKHLTRLF